MRTLALLLFSCLAVVANGEATACTTKDYPLGSLRKELVAAPMPAAPYFYVRTFDYHYFLAISSLDVVAEAERLFGPAGEFSSHVKSVLPLQRNFDLSAVVLQNPDLFTPLQWFTTRILEQGKAAIVRLPDGGVEATAVMEVQNTASM